MPKPDLDSAYDLKTPAETRRFYADWAKRYDAEHVGVFLFELTTR